LFWIPEKLKVLQIDERPLHEVVVCSVAMQKSFLLWHKGVTYCGCNYRQPLLLRQLQRIWGFLRKTETVHQLCYFETPEYQPVARTQTITGELSILVIKERSKLFQKFIEHSINRKKKEGS